MEALINGLLAVVRTTVKKDLQFTAASSVLLMKQAHPNPNPHPHPGPGPNPYPSPNPNPNPNQVLEQAEKAGITLNADLSATEDLNLMAGVQAWAQSVH